MYDSLYKSYKPFDIIYYHLFICEDNNNVIPACAKMMLLWAANNDPDDFIKVKILY